MTAVRSKSDGQFARVATNLAIGVVGLVIIRLIVQGLAMFQEAGWIVREKLTVVGGVVILVDAMLLSVLVRFAIELRAYLLGRFAEIPGLGTMAANLVFLVTAGIAYTDFKPVTRAWPAIKQLYLWSFFALALIMLLLGRRRAWAFFGSKDIGDRRVTVTSGCADIGSVLRSKEHAGRIRTTTTTAKAGNGTKDIGTMRTTTTAIGAIMSMDEGIAITTTTITTTTITMTNR